MDNRRNNEPRREEDSRWLKIYQQAIANLEVEIGNLKEHVEEVDDHLRGVAGESLDTRVVILEKMDKTHTNELRAHGSLLMRISDKLEEMKSDLSTLKVMKAMSKESAVTRADRFKEWLKFWGPIILGLFALMSSQSKLIFDNWEKIEPLFHGKQWDAKKLQEEVDREKKGPRGKAVRKKIKAIEQERRELE
jgi:hypothetical protein